LLSQARAAVLGQTFCAAAAAAWGLLGFWSGAVAASHRDAAAWVYAAKIGCCSTTTTTTTTRTTVVPSMMP